MRNRLLRGRAGSVTTANPSTTRRRFLRLHIQIAGAIMNGSATHQIGHAMIKALVAPGIFR